MNNTRIRNNPYALMGILILFWGSFSAVSKLVLSIIDSFQAIFYAFSFAFFIMTVFIFFSNRVRELKLIPPKIFLNLVLIGVTQFLYFFLYTLSLDIIPAFEASMLNYLSPIFIVILAVPINGEKLNASKVISLVIGFTGVIVIITGGSIGNLKLSNLFGDFLAIASAVCWGLFSNLCKRNTSNAFASNYIYTVTAWLLSIISLLLFSSFPIPSVGGLFGGLWMCFSSILTTYVLWFRILKIAHSSLAATLSFFTPFITLVFIFVLLGERITIIQVLGVVIILAATVLQNIAKKSEMKSNTNLEDARAMTETPADL